MAVVTSFCHPIPVFYLDILPLQLRNLVDKRRNFNIKIKFKVGWGGKEKKTVSGKLLVCLISTVPPKWFNQLFVYRGEYMFIVFQTADPNHFAGTAGISQKKNVS